MPNQSPPSRATRCSRAWSSVRSLRRAAAWLSEHYMFPIILLGLLIGLSLSFVARDPRTPYGAGLRIAHLPALWRRAAGAAGDVHADRIAGRRAVRGAGRDHDRHLPGRDHRRAAGRAVGLHRHIGGRCDRDLRRERGAGALWHHRARAGEPVAVCDHAGRRIAGERAGDVALPDPRRVSEPQRRTGRLPDRRIDPRCRAGHRRRLCVFARTRAAMPPSSSCRASRCWRRW